MRALATLIVACVMLAKGEGRAEVLITPEEANLPAAANATLSLRGITRGPGIEQASPAPDNPARSPLPLSIKFQVRNNVPIDPASVKLILVKVTPVDLTDRIRPHLKPDGIEMKSAEVPPGIHVLRLDLKDQQGRIGTALIKLTVK
jgi:hypothetical protein